MCKHCPVSLDRLTQVISFPLTRAFKTIWSVINIFLMLLLAFTDLT